MPTKQQQLLNEHLPDAITRRLDAVSGSNYIADAVLGAIDGCVTTLAVVSGAFGAGFSASVALILGFANLVADGFSMAVSNYEAIRAQQDFTENVRKHEQDHIDRIPAGEREEIRQIFRRKGFSGEVLETIVTTICNDSKLWIDTMLTEEHGIQHSELYPYKSGGITFLAFVVVGSVPLVPLLIPGLTAGSQFISSSLLAAVMFFGIGSMKSLVFAKPVLRSGLYTLLTGGAAAGLAFLTGFLLRLLMGIAGP